MHRTDFSTDNNPELQNETTFSIYTGPPGCGKSTRRNQEMVAIPAPYILATPRINLAEEHAARLRELATAHGAELAIQIIHSDQPGNGPGVDRRLQDALKGPESPHTIIITTHAGLMGLEPNDFKGWHVCIDELPDAVVSDKVGLGTSWPALAALYDLVPGSEVGWFRLVPRKDVGRVGLRQVLGDVSKKLVEMHRLAASRGRIVEVDIATWADAGISKCRVRWRSMWPLTTLRCARTVTIAAAGYAGSLLDHATRRLGDVQVKTVQVGSSRTGQPRIEIRYYTCHPASTKWWETQEGSACVAKIGRHLRKTEFSGYWTANKDVGPYLRHQIGGVEVSPRSAGTNNLREFRECAVIYSCKATPADSAVIEALGIDRSVVQSAREDEDIYQTVTRGAIRNADFDENFVVHVYDKGQAERLEARLLAGGYTVVVVVPVPEVGIMNVERPRAACAIKFDANDVVETAAERQERKRVAEVERGRRRREIAKAAKLAAGTYRSRGRPKR